jgi:hypothetical protein
MVTVYHARVLDTECIERVITPHKGTRKWISMLPHGEPILDTAEEVSPDDLDGQGCYIPKKRRRGSRHANR